MITHTRAISRRRARKLQLTNVQLPSDQPRMKIIATITICLTFLSIGTARSRPPCMEEEVLYVRDLTKEDSGPPDVISEDFIEELVLSQSQGDPVYWQGVLRAAWPSTMQEQHALRFVFELDTPTALGNPAFHIGDSETNRADRKSIASEVYNERDQLTVYAADNSNQEPFLAEERLTTKVTVEIAKNFVLFDDGDGVQRSYCNNRLFPLDETDNAIYLGMNRIIDIDAQGDDLLRGSGLRHVTISALKCDKMCELSEGN